MPYFLAADSRKSKTSFSETIERCIIVKKHGQVCDDLCFRRRQLGQLVCWRAHLKVTIGTLEGLNQMIAVNRGRDGRLSHATRHKLEESHLSRGVLHGDPVRRQPKGAKQARGRPEAQRVSVSPCSSCRMTASRSRAPPQT